MSACGGLRRLLSVLLVVATVVVGDVAWAGEQKTVHVKPYTKKDGTPVKGYDRRAPTKKGSTEDSAPTIVTPGQSAPGDSAEAHDGPLNGETSQLVGFTAARVREVLGTPSLVSNGVWNYDRGQRTLHLYFKNGVVAEVSPADLELNAFAPPQVQSPKPPAATSQPPQPPDEAVAQCGDGLFVFVATGSKTCAGHGGVTKWLK
jgi:hypothetical protein